ncbi:flagellar biosynthesis protein FlgC [Alteribacter lacisalsi]|uniref:Flagellar biosynthesis protein FlgC n=1 Tax=Alteribacter lacisalsi TaxID=2045244 RepID=A0A2W0H7I7_9BACI|nr:flagellar hook-basal body protein [Alteribacter lacisalsi]PYZ96060.1 flagellar biosynthesis protein FlgC [Alteribacter lacisalsi]
MIRGMNTAAAGMIAQQRRQEMLTDNLNNMNTPGYKADQASLRTFPNMLIQATGQGKMGGLTGELAAGVYMQERTSHFAQGDMQETGNSTDLALLQGNVSEGAMLFFTIESQDGDARFTRNGNFTVDGNGFLATSGGHYVLGTDGERIETENDRIRVDGDGSVFSETGDGEALLSQLNVTLITEPEQLVREGGGLLRYEGTEEAAAAEAGTYQIEQGFIERSNVDPSRTMTEMMAALRAFEANQKVLQTYDRSLERTMNDVGRIG